MNQYVYTFAQGNASMKDLLGGKGANLAEMTRIGLAVPRGFVVTTEVCSLYHLEKQRLPDEVLDQIAASLASLEQETGKTFGLAANPLLVSVRSGAAVSMPGMMDTILNLGLNDDTVEGLARLSGDPRFAYDSYRRFLQMFADVVLSIQKYEFDQAMDQVKRRQGVTEDTALSVGSLKTLVEASKTIVRSATGREFPMDPREQLHAAVEAVFRSWDNSRARVYRDHHGISHDLGTAVTVQEMVFGNLGNTSGTGVAFTRHPGTGEPVFFGEFLMNAQGEDVVAGIRTPQGIEKLATILPGVFDQFQTTCAALERHFRDMQDIEFTVEQGRLFLLQTRNAKRTATAAVRVAVDMVKEGLIDRRTALVRVTPAQIEQVMHPVFDPEAVSRSAVLATGLPASPGAASGRVYFRAEDVQSARRRGEMAILVRNETSPEDIEGMIAGTGILTACGGMTSHAAVVARGMGKCCVAGCAALRVDEHAHHFEVGGTTVNEGDWISLDGGTGQVFLGQIPTSEARLDGAFQQFLSWADEVRRLRVHANADHGRDARNAIRFGAQGLGLCRTEHMFFTEERILAFRRMILSPNDSARARALEGLIAYQRGDFIEIFEAMEDRPVTIRLLDPPLHEFLPTDDRDIDQLARALPMDKAELTAVIRGLAEFNPMLGHRGCRLAITWPEIYAMQTKAIVQAAVEVKTRRTIDVNPEIMIPLVGFAKELEVLTAQVRAVADEVLASARVSIPYRVGTMIEVPRAALIAESLAQTAEFFSFGTNDLTQMTLGFSRDDSGRFIDQYLEAGVLTRNPFETIDQVGVGQLMTLAVEAGRRGRPDLKTGICGEHGGEPDSIDFCHRIGLDYVSCSPFRVPVARLAAAQAALRHSGL